VRTPTGPDEPLGSPAQSKQVVVDQHRRSTTVVVEHVAADIFLHLQNFEVGDTFRGTAGACFRARWRRVRRG
jgi:hypothetical protein